MSELLKHIDQPQDLHGLTDEELQQIAQVTGAALDVLGGSGKNFAECAPGNPRC